MNETYWDIHDSVFAGAVIDGDEVVLRIEPAIVFLTEEDAREAKATHQQSILVRIRGIIGKLDLTPLNEQSILWSGSVSLHERVIDGVIHLPIHFKGPCRLRLFLVGSGTEVDISGQEIHIEPTSPPIKL